MDFEHNKLCWKVLLVFPSPELGGAERQGMHLARYLKRRGCEVHVWSTLPGHGRVVEECVADDIPWAAHRFLWPCRKSSLVRDGWRLILALRQLRPDVILSYTTSPNVGCGLFWRFSRAKVCIWGQRSTNDLRGDIIERLSYRSVRAVICNASHEVKYLEKTLGNPFIPMHVIHNGLDLAPAERTNLEWRNELKIPENAFFAVMLANFRPQKDHLTLLHAWAQMISNIEIGLPRPYLVLAGAPQFTFKDIKRQAEELGLIETIRFPGQVKDVSGLLAACDIGVLISKQEGLPNAVLEYMATGLPVIATDLPGNREALGSNIENQLCKRSDSDDLAMKIQPMMRDKNLRLQTGLLNKSRADECFSIQSMCQQTVTIISNLLQDAK